MLYNRKHLRSGVPPVPRVGLFAAIPHPVNRFSGNITTKIKYQNG